MPRWSPDGSQLVFRRLKPVNKVATAIQRADVLLAADGGGERPLTTPQATMPAEPSVSHPSTGRLMVSRF